MARTGGVAPCGKCWVPLFKPSLATYVHLLPSDLPEPPAAFDQMAQGRNDISRAKPVEAAETAV